MDKFEAGVVKVISTMIFNVALEYQLTFLQL